MLCMACSDEQHPSWLLPHAAVRQDTSCTYKVQEGQLHQELTKIQAPATDMPHFIPRIVIKIYHVKTILAAKKPRSTPAAVSPCLAACHPSASAQRAVRTQ